MREKHRIDWAIATRSRKRKHCIAEHRKEIERQKLAAAIAAPIEQERDR